MLHTLVRWMPPDPPAILPVMPATALARQPDDATQPYPVSRKRISKRMQKVLTLLATKGMTQREAAKQCGMSETYLSTALRKPEIGAFISRKARETIGIGVLRASNRVLELVDASSEHVSLDASKHILAIEGIKPASDSNISVNVGVSVGYVIDLSGNAATSQPDVKVIDGTG